MIKHNLMLHHDVMRFYTLGDTHFGGFPYGTPVKYPILWRPGAGFDVRNSHPINYTNSFSSSRRKDLARKSRTDCSADNRECLRNSRSGDFSSDVEIVESHTSNLWRSARVKEAGQGESGGYSLPVQGRLILYHHIMIGAVSGLLVTDLVGMIR
ncbi:hypothetical protein MKW92_051252 [Papaver armeniacum]|nr:hypothetical protein MKW92_051252 [Papaver armeniacum]